MQFITGKHLSRRTFLRGTGASVALPFMDAMVPAGRAWRDPAQSFTRLICIEEDLGHAGGSAWGEAQHLFGPEKVGRDFEFPADSQLKPLEAYREYMTIVSNTDSRMAEPYRAEEIGGDHDRTTAVFLTQSHPKQTQGADLYLGKSIDQIHAERFGRDTALPSLEVTTERQNFGGGCGYNYHCAYRTSVSWKSANEPLPGIREPRAVFEQLFGNGASAEQRSARLRTKQSVLDWIVSEMADLKRDLGVVDRQALDQYTTHIRELERRIQLMEAQNSSGEERQLPEAPSGVPDTWTEHVELMFDLQILALQADLTRVSSFKYGAQSNGTFPESGVNKAWHSASHHGNVPTAILEFNTINTYRIGRMSYFLDKMKSTMEGEASLLDKSLVMWGSAMGDPNLHNHRRCPLLLLGHANGALEGNLHLRAPDGTPMANVFVSLMQAIGHDDFARFGDSTGEFSVRAPQSSVSEAGL
jgi:hypothetical protein